MEFKSTGDLFQILKASSLVKEAKSSIVLERDKTDRDEVVDKESVAIRFGSSRLRLHVVMYVDHVKMCLEIKRRRRNWQSCRRAEAGVKEDHKAHTVKDIIAYIKKVNGMICRGELYADRRREEYDCSLPVPACE